VSTPEPGVSAASTAARTPRHLWLRRLLPHVITACVAVVLSLAVQALRAPQPTATPTPQPTATPTPQSTPHSTPAPPLAVGIAQQELADLRAENSQLWMALYLYKAVSQIGDAQTVLRSNDLANVDQALVAIDDSLALAYTRADESVKSPIEQLRRDVSAMHDDLHFRPEGMHARFDRLRQSLLTLIGD